MIQPSSEKEAYGSATFRSWLRFWRMVVAGVQILGGFVGIYTTVILFFGNASAITRVICAIFALLYAAAVYGGILLALNKALGLPLSFIVQGAQLLQIWTDGFAFSFVCGLQLLCVISPSENGLGLQFFASLASVFNLYFGSPPVGSPRIIGINLVAVLAMICLLYLKFGRLVAAPELGPDQNAWASPPKPAPPEEKAWPPPPNPDA